MNAALEPVDYRTSKESDAKEVGAATPGCRHEHSDAEERMKLPTKNKMYDVCTVYVVLASSSFVDTVCV